nr:hypothetical protein [Tanacetum cinerariifolium]
MDMKIDQQVVMEEALVPHAHRLRIERSNFCLLSDISSKESTLQLVYDVLRLTSFFKAFLVIADVLEIYMQEFWATAIVYHHSIWFKMDNKKHIVNLESFREMLHICPRLPAQSFVEPPFKEEILAFLRFLGHSGAIRRLTNVNINKLLQPWRSFAAIINKCLTGKSLGYDSMRLSQTQILWGLYHKRNVDFAYLMWEEFVYQVEPKDTKKSNEMYYPRFTKVIIHHFMSKDPSIPRRNKVNWHYVRDDHMFTTIKLEYYAVATGATPPKTKASVRKTRSSFDTTFTPPTTATGPRLSTSLKGKHPATTSKAKSLTALSENSTNEEGKDDDDDAQDDDAQNDDDQEDEGNDDNDQEEGNGEEDLGMNVGRKEGQDEEDEEDELYREVNINLGRGIQMDDVHTTQEFKDSHVTLTPVNPDGQQQISSVSSQFVTKANFSEFTQTNQFSTISSILGIVHRYIDQRMNEAVKVAVQLQSDRLCDEAQKENDEFLKTIDENMQKIIKEQVKEQVKVQVSKILSKIKQTVNEQLEAKVLTQSSNLSKTSYAIAVDLSEMELKKILIKKMKGNKSIHRSNEKRNLYKALVEAYESDKIILDTYGDTVTLKRRRDDADKDKEHSAGSDQGSKRRREGKEPESASAPNEKATRSAGKSTQGLRQACPLGNLPLGGKRQQFYGFAVNRESARDVYSKHRIIAVTELKIVEWHNYKHLDWIPVHRDNDKLYKFKEGDFKRFRIQDIEDMLLLLVQGKLTNLTVEERFAFTVSLRMFTRSIVIQRRVEDLQLAVESYEKKLNLTNPDTYRSDLKRKEAYIAYSNPRGFIYQNKDKQNRLMRIDELHKFSDGTLTDVRTALDNRLKGIQMKYLSQLIWRKSNKDRAAAMIQANDKQLKTRRIMRCLERFVGGKLYEGDFRML